MHNFIGITNKTNNFRKGTYTDPYDEPTYLTFALDFQFEEFDTVLQENELWKSNLFSQTGAIQFLQDRGYSNQAHGLSVFKSILRFLTFNAPWYFQSIDGLTKLWSNATDIAGGYKGNGATLTVETLEAVDLRITQLADIYRNAIYDKIYMRERVPENLQWFTMDIYIAEARNLRFQLPGIAQNIATTFGVNTGAIGNIVGAGNLLSNVLGEYGYVKFKCRQCQFDFSESFAGAQPGKQLKAETTMSPEKNQFKINIGYFEEESKYSNGTKLFDSAVKTEINNPWNIKSAGTAIQNTASFLSGLPIVGEGFREAGASIKSAFAQVGGLINPALQAASEFLDPPTKDLGNVYGNNQ